MVDIPDDVAAQIAAILSDVVPTASDPVVVQNYIDVLTPPPPPPVVKIVDKTISFISDGIANSYDANYITSQIINFINARLSEKLDNVVPRDFISSLQSIISNE